MNEFQELAADLITGDWGAYRVDVLFTQSTGVDFDTQTETTQTQTIKCIPKGFTAYEINGNSIKSGDTLFISEALNFSWVPGVDNTSCSTGGKSYTIVSVQEDAANAVLKIQARLV
jgi:hypothetical protein